VLPKATPAPTPTPQPMLVAKATPPPNLRHVEEASTDQIPIFLNRKSEPKVPTNVAPARPEQPEPARKPTPKATPEPKATPVPKATPQPATKPPVEPQSEIVAAKLDTKPLQPRPVPNPGYSPQMRRTKVNGANMPPGDDGVDALGTPAGRYKKAVSSAVGSRWNYYIQQRMSLLQTGKILVHFSIDQRGKLRGFRVDENTSNSAHAALVEQCVREAEFDPPPAEMLRNGVFEYPMSFNLY
jgi:outer membrane biosynthesis protein TonB